METKKMNRRMFVKYSLGVGGGLILAPNLLGVLEAQEKKEPGRGERLQKITFTTVNRSDHVELGRTCANSLKELGVEIEIELVELGTFLTKAISKHEVDMSGLSYAGVMNRLDPSFFLTEFYHSKYAVKGGYNYQHYRNPEYDKVCNAANMEMDRNKRIELVRKCQEIIAKDCPIWPIGFPDSVHAYNSQDWEDPVSYWGSGIGGDYNPWTLLKMRPKTSRKKLVTATVVDYSSLSLATRSGQDRGILRYIYDTFVKIDPKLNVVPWAAESWKIVDNKTIDIVLRRGMKFHDGKPVTIEDAKFTFDYFKTKKMALYKWIYDRIETTEILPDSRLRFHLTEPYGSFVENILTDAHILPKHIWEKIDDPDKYPNEKPIGSGSFKFGYWKRGEELYLEANKDHFDPPKMEGVYKKTIPSLEGIIAALENKQIDLHHDRLDIEMANRLGKLPHITIVSSPNHGVYDMRGDLEKKPFNDLQFRKAVNYAIPRKQYMEQIAGASGIVAWNSILHPDLKPWFHEKVGTNEYSPQKAREILKAAGYWWDKDGLLHYPR